MDNIYKSFGQDIEASQGSDGPLFNGHASLHAALLESNEQYASFNFADQMIICVAVMDDVYPLPADEVPPEPTFPIIPNGRLFYYTYEWYVSTDDYACMVLDSSNGNMVFDEWFSILKKAGVMDTVDDAEGLLMYLLKHGELLEGDTLQVQKDQDDSKT